MLIPVPVRSKPRLQPLFAEIAGSNPAGGHGSLSVVSVALSGRGLCDEPIPRPEDSYRVCVCMCVSFGVIRCNSNPLHYSE